MNQHNMQKLLGIMIAILFIAVLPLTAHAAKPGKAVKASKERLVLMPLRVAEEDKSLQGAMETALVQGLQQKYEVFSGEQVAQKAKEIFNKESHSTKKECDETRCMQGIAEAFQAELIATANVTKRDGGYFLALSIQNIFDNKVVYSNSVPCKSCDSFQVVDKLKELSGSSTLTMSTTDNREAPKANDPESALWSEVQKGNSIDDYQAYLAQYPKGKYVALARSRIKKLQEQVAVEATQQEQIVWDSSNKSATEAGYQNYLQSYPQGRYATLAQARITKLKKEAIAPEKIEADIKLAESYWKGEGVPKDYAKAFELLSPLATQGNAKAQNRLSTLYLGGPGITQDYAKALEWLQKSAAQGFANAQHNLGNMYVNGHGVPQDYAKALEWYQKSAAQGFANAQIALASMYEKGQGVTQDFAEAFEWTQKSAIQGSAIGQLHLGWLYSVGQGVTKDYAKAIEWNQKSAAQGNSEAQWNMGLNYKLGHGVTKDDTKAFEWFQKSAEQGYAEAQNSLGVIYEEGRGVTRDIAKAIEWYQKAAAQGNAGAKVNLSRLGK